MNYCRTIGEVGDRTNDRRRYEEYYYDGDDDQDVTKSEPLLAVFQEDFLVPKCIEVMDQGSKRDDCRSEKQKKPGPF